MKKQRLITSAAALLVAIAASAMNSSAPPLPSEDEGVLPSEDKRATDYIIWALTLEKSPSVRVARERCQDYCSDHGGGIEVAIDLLGIGGPATTDSLLDLLAVQLDAGGAESRSCQIAKRGKALVPALRKFDPVKASQWCGTTFNRLRQRELSEVNDVPVEQMCRPATEVDSDRQEWIAALGSGRDLLAESGPC